MPVVPVVPAVPVPFVTFESYGTSTVARAAARQPRCYASGPADGGLAGYTARENECPAGSV